MVASPVPANTPQPAAPASSRRELFAALGLVLAVAAVLRVVGLDFGVPDLWHPDEQRLIYNPAKRFAAGEGLGLRWWPHPPLMAELVGTVLWLFPFDPPTLRAIHVGRGISACLGVAGVGGTAMAAWRLSGRALPTVCAGLLVAVSPIAVQLSHYATPDGAALGCVGLCLWACAELLTRAPAPASAREHPWLLNLAAGAITGLAGAFKYNAAMVAVLVIAVALARIVRGWSREARRGRVLAELGGLGVAGLAALAVFGLSLAPVVGELDALHGGLSREWTHYRQGHAGFESASAGLEALRTLASCGLGPPALAACLGVVVLREPTGRAVAIALLALTCAYLALLWPQRVFFDRVTFVLLPPLALLAALGMQALLERLVAESRRRAVWLVALVVLLFIPTQRAVMLVHALDTRDTRALARDYLRARTTLDTKILHLPKDIYLAPTISGRQNLRPGLPTGPRLGLRRRPHYVVVVEGYWERFESDPDGGEDALALREAWLGALSRRYRVLWHIRGPDLPCRGCPGTTLSAYHQPDVTIYQRSDLAP